MQSVFFNGAVIAFSILCGKTEKIALMSLNMNGVIYSGCWNAEVRNLYFNTTHVFQRRSFDHKTLDGVAKYSAPKQLNVCLSLPEIMSTKLVLHSHLLWRRANARNVSFITHYGGQFTFST